MAAGVSLTQLRYAASVRSASPREQYPELSKLSVAEASTK